MSKPDLLARVPPGPLEDPPDRTLAEAILALASNKDVDVEKLRAIVGLQEHLLERGARGAYSAAMSVAQTEMRPVAADADNPQTRSRYASYAQLDRALRPIYTRHGFALSFDTGETPLELHVRVLCYVSHRDGFERTYHVDMPADGKGAKGGDVMTRTHATGAAMSYGMRYLLKMIFNVAIGEDDLDGNQVVAKSAPNAPKGFADWLDDLTATAENGTADLMKAFNESPETLRKHLTRTNVSKWEELKRHAAGRR